MLSLNKPVIILAIILLIILLIIIVATSKKNNSIVSCNHVDQQSKREEQLEYDMKKNNSIVSSNHVEHQEISDLTGIQQSKREEQLEYDMKKNSINHYIDNDLLSGVLQLQSAKYLTPEIVPDTRYINLHDKELIKKEILPLDCQYNSYFSFKSCLSPDQIFNDTQPLKHSKEYHQLKHTCQEKAIRRCKLPPMHSTRCHLNECELSSYNQCTNNIHNQNSCECKANELCKEPDQLRHRCYLQRYDDCINKNSVNKYR